MNECEQASRLNAYHDGEMSPADSAQLERHLHQCPHCAAELDRIQRLTTWLSATPAPALSPAAMNRLHETVNGLVRNSVLRLAEWMAALAATILLVCTLSLSRQSPVQGSPGSMPVWESDAVSQQPADATADASDESLVRWVEQDLSRKGEHD